jgi:CHAD domain-containing protein
LPADRAAIATFKGSVRRRDDAATGATLHLLSGTIDAGGETRPAIRLALGGRDAVALAFDLATTLGAGVPMRSLAAEALALAGAPLPAPASGAPLLHDAPSVSEAMAAVCSHLTEVIRHQAPLAALGDGVEPVHQMRVAVRRLRSALKIFDSATACDEMADAAARLRELGRILGPARDWDVFLDGAGEAVRTAFAGDAAVRRLLAAGSRKRDAHYAALRDYLAGPDYRKLEIRLTACAVERPWERDADVDRLAVLNGAVRDLAVRTLSRHRRRVLAAGEDISALDEATLHDIRLRAKRLRYAAELFHPLYGRGQVRRFLRRVIALQERMGYLNDGVAAAALMAELAGSGRRRFAAGVVRGFIAGRAGGARRKVQASWRKLCQATPFWT